MRDYNALGSSVKNCTKYLTVVTSGNCMGDRLGGQLEVALNDNWHFSKLLYVF